MKRFPQLPLTLLLCLPFFAAGQASMTLRTAKIIEQAEASQPSSSLLRSVSAEEQEVGALLTVEPGFNAQRFADVGAKIGTQVGNTVALRATPSQLRQIATMDGVAFMAANNRARPKLDVAVPLVKADSVQRGLGGLPQAYTGSNVVVGIVDQGFDYTHPTFYDSLGNLRIARAWNQLDKSGYCRPSYGYGSVYDSQDIMEQKICSAGGESHGTHVAGIAAGGGGQAEKYKGVAPEANIVLVQLRDGSDSEILDGIDYVFRYAQSQGKPAVVNLSLGYHFGPHDGTSSFDQALDGLVGTGKIVVGAAGNEGDIKLHASHSFAGSTDTMRTEVGIAGRESYAMAWMEIGKQLNWNVEIWDKQTKKLLNTVNTSRLYSTSQTTGGGVENKKFFYNSNRDTVIISAQGYGGDGNNIRGIVEVLATNAHPDKYSVVLVLKATSGKVHLWNTGDDESDAEFSALIPGGSTWVDGDTECTVGEIGGTAKKIISVGATYNSTLSSTIAYFSSLGPTADGRTKPDLVAPGSSLVSSVNSCDSEYKAWNTVANETRGAKTYYYARMQGTSMAAPMVAGAVALLLQECPTLTPDSVRNILKRTALLDEAILSLPENTRGAGKLNVLKAVKAKQGAACSSIPVVPYSDCSTTSIAFNRSEHSELMLPFNIVPNPNSGVFYLDTEEGGTLTLNVYSMAGQLLHTGQVQAHDELTLSHLPQGLYLMQLNSGEKQGVKKMLINR